MNGNIFFDLASTKTKKTCSGGSIISVTSNEMSGLVNISFSALRLKKNGFQEPIWHPNANKIGYCIQGSALVNIRTPKGAHIFTIEKGDVFFIPKGNIYTIENIANDDAEMVFALDHDLPDEMYLSKAVYSLSNHVFNATFGTNTGFLDGLKKNTAQEPIKILELNGKKSGLSTSQYKFNIDHSKKVVQSHGGYLQASLKDQLPILDGLGILTFGLTPQGVVEPHWHTNAGELIYIVKGQTRITVLAPDGHVDTLEVGAGQGAFAAASHFHNIENIGKGDVEVVAFFNDAEPDFIGVGEVLGSYSNEVLASLFNVESSYFERFKKTEEPLLIVG